MSVQRAVSIRFARRELTGFGNDEDVVAAAEGILEDGGRAQEDIRVVSLGLSG